MSLHFSRWAGRVAIAALCSTVAFGADEPTPASPQQERGIRGDRGARGPGGENTQERRTFATRGAFGGLNLDEKQNELLREAMQAESDELRKLYEKLQAAQRDLLKAILDEKYDETSVRQKAEAVSKIQTDITVLRAKAFASVVPTLKPEQRDQIENNRAAASVITGAAVSFGPGAGGLGGPEQMQDRRRGERGGATGAGDPNQTRRRGDRPGQ